MKKLLILSVLWVSVISLSACGSTKNKPQLDTSASINTQVKKETYKKNLTMIFEGYTFLDICDVYIDNNYVYFCGEKKEYIDKQSFEWISGRLSKDKNNVYINGNIFEVADGNSIQVLTETYDGVLWKDKNNVFFNDIILGHLDVNSFELLEQSYAKDKNGIYRDNSMTPNFKYKIDGVDINTFKIDIGEDHDAKDKNNYYKFGKNIDKNIIKEEMVFGVHQISGSQVENEGIYGTDLKIAKILVNKGETVNIQDDELSIEITIQNIGTENAKINTNMEISCSSDFMDSPVYTFDSYQSFYSKELITYDDFVLKPNEEFNIKRTGKLKMKGFKLNQIGTTQYLRCHLYDHKQNNDVNHDNNHFKTRFLISE